MSCKKGTGKPRPNKLRIEKLTAAGPMADAGLRKVEQARHDGSWNRLDAVEDLQIPEDLLEGLQQWPPAMENFSAFPRSATQGIQWRPRAGGGSP